MTRTARRKTNQTIRLSLDRPTGNFWVDTGLVVLIQRFGEGEHNAQEVLEWVQGQLLQKSGNKGEYCDPSTKRIREYEKVNWVYPANLFIKVAGSAPKVKVNGKEYFTHPPKFELRLKLSKKAEVCDMCGETAPITDATMWMYPFIVEPSKVRHFLFG